MVGWFLFLLALGLCHSLPMLADNGLENYSNGLGNNFKGNHFFKLENQCFFQQLYTD